MQSKEQAWSQEDTGGGANGEDPGGGAPSGGTHSEPQNWHEDYFKLKALGNEQLQNAAFLALI